ncbi:PP2C family protein-serine/threonine phosphatase [Streptomyces sp. NRRL S-813]|uniref:PP2C family protein-serine/threonine phosphatase n=1 Tax=Streptomyces sp. NRRL S-813 TaxID=1463919 RepID=UPI00068F796C|nr:GAF domain-containing SpoIIE family protein phosphatase [Streptomyces sp. NRRL S-813]
MAGTGEEPEQPGTSDLTLRLDAQLEQIAQQLRDLATAKDRLQGLLDAVLTISRETELPTVLHRIVTTAMGLVGARYGALGVLDESGEVLEQFITAGLSESERADLAGIEFPRGRGVLGHLIHHPEPLRVDDIASHPASAGFPPGHPHMRTLLGVAVSVRGTIYGDLYLSERSDGQPFDRDDEDIVITLAGAAGIAIENARLFEQIRDSAEHFQRLLLPTLPDLNPFTAAATYRPAPTPGHLGGDWYDALLLPDNACAVVIGDVVGHDLHAAAAMAQTRSMLRALLFDRLTPPSTVLHQLDRTLHAITDLPVTTACLARIEPEDGGWTLHWSTAGHLPPLLITPDRRTQYLHAEPGLPLAVSTEEHRPDHTHPLPPGATVLFFTDGLIERPDQPVDEGMAQLAELATHHVGLPLQDFVNTLADHHPSDGHDDMAILALRVPLSPDPAPPQIPPAASAATEKWH